MMVILRTKMLREVQRLMSLIILTRDYFDYVSFKDTEGAYPYVRILINQETGFSLVSCLGVS